MTETLLAELLSEPPRSAFVPELSARSIVIGAVLSSFAISVSWSVPLARGGMRATAAMRMKVKRVGYCWFTQQLVRKALVTTPCPLLQGTWVGGRFLPARSRRFLVLAPLLNSAQGLA